MTWDEAAHPRAAGGKFASRSGGGTSSKADDKTPAATTAEIKDFQRRYDLPVTGRFDARTLRAFRAADAKPKKRPAKPVKKAHAKAALTVKRQPAKPPYRKNALAAPVTGQRPTSTSPAKTG